jgi:hypothetical protein
MAINVRFWGKADIAPRKCLLLERTSRRRRRRSAMFQISLGLNDETREAT